MRKKHCADFKFPKSSVYKEQIWKEKGAKGAWHYYVLNHINCFSALHHLPFVTVMYSTRTTKKAMCHYSFKKLMFIFKNHSKQNRHVLYGGLFSTPTVRNFTNKVIFSCEVIKKSCSTIWLCFSSFTVTGSPSDVC